MSLKAYQQTQQTAENPAESEFRLFGQVTAALIEAEDRKLEGRDLMEALDWNRRLWTVLTTDCAVEGNGLPDGLRAGIISLGIFVTKHTSRIMKGEAEIGDLIDINKNIMEGLSAQIKPPRSDPAQPGDAVSAGADDISDDSA